MQCFKLTFLSSPTAGHSLSWYVVVWHEWSFSAGWNKPHNQWWTAKRQPQWRLLFFSSLMAWIVMELCCVENIITFSVSVITAVPVNNQQPFEFIASNSAEKLIVNLTLSHKVQWKSNRNSVIFIQENAFEKSSVKWRPFCPGGDELKCCSMFMITVSLPLHELLWYFISLQTNILALLLIKQMPKFYIFSFYPIWI